MIVIEVALGTMLGFLAFGAFIGLLVGVVVIHDHFKDRPANRRLTAMAAGRTQGRPGTQPTMLRPHRRVAAPARPALHDRPPLAIVRGPHAS